MSTVTKQKPLVPELRFSGFDGEWKVSSLGQESIFHDEKRIPLKQADREKRDGEYRYYGASGVIDQIDDYLFDGEYVLLGEDGANITDRSSRLAFLVSGKFWVNNHAHVIEAKGSTYFLAEYLESLKYDKYNTGTAQPKLNGAICKKIPVIIPELDEQKKIADFIGSVDAWLDNLRGQKTALQSYKQGMMQKLFSGQVRFKDEGGKSFPDWNHKQLGEIEDAGDIKLGRGEVISKIDIANNPGDYPIYSSSVKNNGLFGVYGNHLFDEELITWSVDGGGHFFYRPKHKFSVTNVSGWMRIVSPDICTKFFMYQLQFQHAKLVFDYQTKAHPSVIRGMYTMALPTLKEQQKIADFLTAIDQTITTKADEITKVEEWKKGLMQKMFV